MNERKVWPLRVVGIGSVSQDTSPFRANCFKEKRLEITFSSSDHEKRTAQEQNAAATFPHHTGGTQTPSISQPADDF